MRLVDLLTPYLPVLQRCIVVVNGSIDMTPYVTVRDAVELVTMTRDVDALAPPTEPTAVITTAGPDSDHGDLADALGVLAGLPESTLAFFALGWAPQELPVNQLVSALDQTGLQLLQVSGLSYTRLSTALVAVQTVEPVAYRDVQGRGGRQPLPPLTAAATRRLINEHLLLDGTTRRSGSGGALNGRPAVASGEAEAVRAQALRQENAQLAQDLQRAKGAVESLERKVARIESSTSLRVGQALVGAAREPARGARALPREALHLWRSRGREASTRDTGTATPSGASAAVQGAATPDMTGAREFLRWSTTTVVPQRRVSVAGVVTPRTARSLSRSTSLSSLLPHTAAEVVRRTQPDLFLVETAAVGLHGPWAHLGEPGTTERDRDLLSAVRECQAAGVPVVVWRNAPSWRAPGLHWLVEECDLRLEAPEAGTARGTPWAPGVDVSVAAGLPHHDGRRGVLYAGPWPERARASRRRQLQLALEAAAPHGLTILDDPQRDGGRWPAALQEHLQVVRGPVDERRILVSRAVSIEHGANARDGALPPPASLEQLAAGLRLVAPTDHLSCGTSVSSHGPEGGPEAVARAVQLGALKPREHREVLRKIFLEHSPGAAVAQVLSLLGTSMLEVGSEREIVVEAHVADADDAARLAAAIASQRWHPKRLLVTTQTTELGRVFDEVTDLGTSVAVARPDDRWNEVELSDEGWRVEWDGRSWSQDFLLDLALWGEATAAEVVLPSPLSAPASTAGCLLRSAAMKRYGRPGQTLESWTAEGARAVVCPQVEQDEP